MTVFDVVLLLHWQSGPHQFERQPMVGPRSELGDAFSKGRDSDAWAWNWWPSRFSTGEDRRYLGKISRRRN